MVYKLDANGNVIGGVRTPQVDAPIAALGSQGNSGGFCVLFGSTVPYSAAHLASLYKTHGQFVSAWARAIHRDRAAWVPAPRRCRRAVALGSCFTSRTASPLTHLAPLLDAYGGLRSICAVRHVINAPEATELLYCRLVASPRCGGSNVL